MIYTFGDGFAAGHIWPEWPQFLEVIAGPITNFAHIGAGNEYIFNCVIKAALDANPSDIFVVQWTDPNRFDKLIEDQDWRDLQQADPVYKNIKANSFGQDWWSTSASTVEEVLQYKKYIQTKQAENRSVLYMITAAKMLEALKIEYCYSLTYSYDYSTHNNYKDLKCLNWIDLESGLEEWSEQDKYRGTEIQPCAKVHANYVIEKILPKLDIPFNSAQELITLVDQYQFQPYDPDRDHIWTCFKNEFSLLSK